MPGSRWDGTPVNDGGAGKSYRRGRSAGAHRLRSLRRWAWSRGLLMYTALDSCDGTFSTRRLQQVAETKQQHLAIAGECTSMRLRAGTFAVARKLRRRKLCRQCSWL